MSAIHSIVAKIPKPIKQKLKERIYPELLQEGTVAPEWHLQSYDDSWHRLGKRWSILVFYPGDDTPGCTKQLEELEEFHERLNELGCKVYAVNPADAASHRSFAEKYGFSFPILVDRGSAVCRRYQATIPFPGVSKVIRTVYLINPEKKIRLANRGAPSVEAIVRSIEALQQATRDGI